MRRVVLAWCAAGAAVVGGIVAGDVRAQQVDVQTLGPQIGDRVTDFRSVDSHGREPSLASLAGPKGTMLVFFRSADW